MLLLGMLGQAVKRTTKDIQKIVSATNAAVGHVIGCILARCLGPLGTFIAVRVSTSLTL